LAKGIGHSIRALKDGIKKAFIDSEKSGTARKNIKRKAK
jgi:hypothetical protein